MLVITPLTLLAGDVAREAVRVADNVRSWIDARNARGLSGLAFWVAGSQLQTFCIRTATELRTRARLLSLLARQSRPVLADEAIAHLVLSPSSICLAAR